MTNPRIITGIDIGTSKISVVVCQMKSTEDIQVLGLGTSVLKGVQKGVIVDASLFVNALQNCLKRAQAASDQLIEDVFINVPCAIPDLQFKQALFRMMLKRKVQKIRQKLP